MALPKLNTPSYELELPSTDEKIKFRPFLVKEEKILLLAMETEKNEDIVRAVKDIVTECTFNTIDFSNIPMFDTEYVFLQIRAKSVGEVSKLRLLCPDDQKTYADVEVNLPDVKVQVEDGHTNKIELTDDMGIIMTYPTIDTFIGKNITTVNADNMLDIVGSCVLQIYEEKGEKVYEAKDQTSKELSEFLEQLQTTHFRKLQNFFETMPRLKHTIKIKNPKTKKESEVTLNGLNDFFG